MDGTLTFDQFQRFSDCLGAIYDEPTGEDPVNSILDALDRLMRIDSIAVDETRGDGQRILAHRVVVNRRPEIMTSEPDTVTQIAHDHPLILHVLKHGVSPCLKISDFLSERELRRITLYALNNSKHEWRDQAAVIMQTGGGALSFALNRDRVFTSEEFLLLEMLQCHVQRVISRCAWFISLPGNEQLTPREREVLYWITQGKRDEEISVIVACAERTVRQHTRAILRKLGVENRTAAISAVLSGRAHSTRPRPVPPRRR